MSQAEAQFPRRERRSYAMPWSSGMTEVRKNLEKQLSEMKTPSKGRSRRMLQAPGPSCSRYYQIEDFTLNSVATNDRLAMMMGRRERETLRKPSLPTATAEDVRALEKQAMRILQMISTLDWQSTAVVRVIAEMVSRDPSNEMKSLQRLLYSQARTTSHLIGEASTMHANILLRRRDACIDLLPKQTTDGMKKDLRTSSMDLSSNFLFDEAVVKKIAEELPKVATSERLFSNQPYRREQKPSFFKRPSINFSFARSTQQRPQPSSGRQQQPYRGRKDYKTKPKSSSQPAGKKRK